MNFKHPLFFTGIIILIIEISLLIIMPASNAQEVLNEVNATQDFVPYMMFALSGSFLSAVLFLLSGIVFILKASIKENLPTSTTLVLGFLVPVVMYYGFY